MNNPAKRHHFLAQSYLAGFTNDGTKNGNLHVFDLKTTKEFKTSPENVAVRTHYFTVDHPKMAPDEIEIFFSALESDIADVLKKVDTNKVLPDGKDFEILINLVALNFIRNPYSRSSDRDSMQELSKKILSTVAATKDRWEVTMRRLKDAGKEINETVGYEQFQDFITRGEYELQIDNEYLISGQLQKLNILAPMLLERNWSLLISPDTSSGFICSDQPVSLISKIHGLKFGLGFGMSDTSVIMPISKKMALKGDFDLPSVTDTIPDNVVASINGVTIYMAQRQLYFPDKNFTWTMPDSRIGTFRDLECYFKQAAYRVG